MKRAKPGCSGKVRHADQISAIIAMKKMKNAQLSAYKCRFCHGWHVGRSWSLEKLWARFDQLVGKPENQKGS